MKNFHNKEFKNIFVSTFKGDDSGDLSPRQTPGVLYSKAIPTPVPQPKLLAWTEDLAQQLEIAYPEKEDLEILAGNKVTGSMSPYAACYAGHQFGNWAGQLGDGRAISLGEWESGGTSWEFQLKGAGPTAYSRRADGRAVLRSSVREYLMSEAMHHLGVPTTRALSLVVTGEEILRDMFYNGNPAYEPGAIVLRTAPSLLRFGSFEMPAARKDIENLEKLVNWTIEKFYPHITGENKIIEWYKEVVEKTAQLMVEWQRVGFVHGVMNTDNMSILGLTIDYGPFSFLDDYDPNFTPNTTDLPGRRYAFGNQPSIGYWNLGKLANALLPLFEDEKELEEALKTYEDIFWKKYYKMMGNKLGLDEVKPEDQALVHNFEKVLSELKPDMTIFYQLLGEITEKDPKDEAIIEHFYNSFYTQPDETKKSSFINLIKEYVARIDKNCISRTESLKIMEETNPRFILRNYLLHQAIEELEKGEDHLFVKLQKALKNPYSKEYDEFLQKDPIGLQRKLDVLCCPVVPNFHIYRSMFLFNKIVHQAEELEKFSRRQQKKAAGDAVNEISTFKNREEFPPLFLSAGHPDQILNPEVISKFEQNLQMTFLPEESLEGNVCMATSEEVLPAFRTTFSTADLLNYIHSVLDQREFSDKNKKQLRTSPVIPYPKDFDSFWKSVKRPEKDR